MKRRTFITLGTAVAATTALPAHTETVSPPNVAIDYDLGEAGWSSFVLRVGDLSTEVGAFSYTTNALDDLIRVALSCATLAYRTEASFDGEPNEWRLILDEGWAPLMRLRILDFNDIQAGFPEDKVIVNFEARVPADGFARAVQKAAQKIWDAYGSAGYVAAWGGQRAFPLRGLKALDAALATPLL